VERVIYEWNKKARVFVLAKPLQPCLMFVRKAGEEYLVIYE
jgi:hypothetical protein